MLFPAARGWVRPLALGLVLFPAAAGRADAARAAAVTPVETNTAAQTTTAATTAAASETVGYPVRLTRPVSVGQKFHYTANATVLQSLTAEVSGQKRTMSPRSLSVQFEGLEQILAVNAAGEPTRAVYRVEKCVVREGKTAKNVLQPGVLLTAEAGKWKPALQVDQGALTIQDEAFLRAVIALPPADGVSDDDCYGTAKPQKVGDSWAARPDAVARSFAASGVQVKKGNVTGTIRLKDATSVDGVPCLRVQGKTQINHFLPPDHNLPREMRVTDSTVEYKFTKLVPVDPAGHCLSDSYSITVLLKLKTAIPKVGADVPVEGKLLTTVGIRRRPYQPAPPPRE